MGCTSSKESVCRNCQAQYSPVRKSYSSVPNPSPPRDSSGHHVVALTSTTLGYLLVESDTKPNQFHQDSKVVPQKKSEDFAVGLIEAKTWSKMIDEKINKVVPKTPILTPPGEPETINTWELMEGLDDSSSVQPDQPVLPSVSNANDTSIDSSFDHIPNKANLKPELIKEEHDHAKKSLQADENENVSHNKEKLILYFTSLRGVRKTYEDCCHVRVILKNSGARVDERDVSMHSGFKDELKELLSDAYNGGGLPKVFVGKKYIGGADEIRRFHDEYQLDKVLDGCEMVDDCGGDGGVGGGGCEVCGDIRFLPCETCSGSCKVYYEVNSDVGEDEDAEESDCGFQRCPDCNENGLVRCPICCD